MPGRLDTVTISDGRDQMKHTKSLPSSSSSATVFSAVPMIDVVGVFRCRVQNRININ